MAPAFHQVRKILLVVFLLNIATATLKTLWGNATRSLSMQADGIHSFLDAASSLVALIGVWIASRPPDDTHPYGRGKYETFASFCISVFLFFGCFHIVRDSLFRLQDGIAPEVTPGSFGVMLATMALNWGISHWEKAQGAHHKSEVLIADGLHTQSDLLASGSVLVSLVAGRAGYPIVDPIVGLVIAVIIGKVGGQILMESSRTLTDASRIQPAAIAEIVMKIEGARACHKIRTRGNMGQVYVDLHLHVPPEMTMEAAHVVAHQSEAAIMRKFTEVAEVVVHLEPDIPGLEND